MWALFYILGILAGLLVIGWSWYLYEGGKQSRSWPNAPGTITVSKVVEFHDTEEGTTYSPYVAYSYSVRGRAFQGTRVAFGAGASSASSSGPGREIARYPVGAQVRVYYDPRYPESAVLQRTVPNVFPHVLTGVAMVIVFAYLLVSHQSIFAH